MDTNLHVHGCELNQNLLLCHVSLETCSDILGVKIVSEGIIPLSIKLHFSWWSMPPHTPYSFCVLMHALGYKYHAPAVIKAGPMQFCFHWACIYIYIYHNPSKIGPPSKINPLPSFKWKGTFTYLVFMLQYMLLSKKHQRSMHHAREGTNKWRQTLFGVIYSVNTV